MKGEIVYPLSKREKWIVDYMVWRLTVMSIIIIGLILLIAWLLIGKG